jgi:protein-S-isoprenylcysteine O-methyltransferase Ste14
MNYPIDLVFLDEEGCVIDATQNVPANRIAKVVTPRGSVLELPSGAIDEHNIQIGNQLEIEPDRNHRPAFSSVTNLLHWPLNFMIALLWSRFVLTSINTWLQFKTPLHFCILLHNTLLFILFLLRKRSIESSKQFVDFVVPIATLASTMMLRTIPIAGSNLVFPSIVIQCIGMSMMMFSLMSLGRSFGILPANRGIKLSGAYRIVRHPLYTSELVFFTGFLLGNFSDWNLGIICLIIGGQIWRSVREEKILSRDSQYRKYKTKVKYRLVPGIF